VGSIIAALVGVTFDWKPLAFVLARAEDLQRMAESLGVVMPQQGSAEYQFLDLAAAPVAGFLLGLAFARSPLGRWALNGLLPDPPPFLRSDLSAERERTMTLLEAPPPPFMGRHAEREALRSFAVESHSSFLWRAMVGPTGVGKSRLAVEWLQELREAGWDAGVAASDMLAPDNWRPRRPTAIVLDEAGRDWAAALAPALAQLAAAGRSRAPIRVLVVDTVEPNTENVALAEQREAVRTARADAPLVVSGLDKDVFTTLWTVVHGPPRTTEQLKSLHEETAGRPRALLLLTRARPETSYWQALADWAVTLLPELADAPGSAAEAVDRKRLKALALSALAGPVSVRAARPALGGMFDAAPLARFFPAEPLDSELPAMAPEDLGQEILLRALALLDEPEREAITQAAFWADPVAADRVERVLGSLWAERPECDAAIAVTHRFESQVAPPVARRAKALAELQLAFDEAHPRHAAARREEAARGHVPGDGVAGGCSRERARLFDSAVASERLLGWSSMVRR
jgi:hypothetical protein